jgi:hypothetical protein
MLNIKFLILKSIHIFVLLTIVSSCAGIKLIKKSDTSELYRPDFLNKISSVKENYKKGQKTKALGQLESMVDNKLLPTEKALKYNLLGVIQFSSEQIEKSIFNFEIALSTSSLDTELTSQIYLNLASAYFKSSMIEKSQTMLTFVDSDLLTEQEKPKYFHLQYIIANQLGRQQVALKSLIEFLGYSKSLTELRQSPLLERLVEGFSKLGASEKLRLLDEYGERKLISAGYLAFTEAEKLYYSGDKAKSKELVDWINQNFEATSEIVKLSSEFDFRVSNFSKINSSAIGIVLPFSEKNSSLSKKAMLGLDFALQKIKNNKTNPNSVMVYYRDSSGEGVVGAHAVRELIETHNVSLIIGGMNSKEAAREYLEAKKYGVFFISLNSIYLPRKEKNHLLLEIPGSVESQVHALMSPEVLDSLGRRAAIFYPDSEKGKAFVDEFWDRALKNNLAVKKIYSYSNEANDYTESVKGILSLKHTRERIEEYDIVKEIHELEKKRGPRRLQTLEPLIDFDWVYLPATPQKAQQIIPAFEYLDASKVQFMGEPSWRSKGVVDLSKSQSKLYFIGDDMGSIDEALKEDFKRIYDHYPSLVEILSYDSMKIALSLVEKSQFQSRDELDQLLKSDSLKLKGLSGTWNLSENMWIKTLIPQKIHRGKIESFTGDTTIDSGPPLPPVSDSPETL